MRSSRADSVSRPSGAATGGEVRPARSCVGPRTAASDRGPPRRPRASLRRCSATRTGAAPVDARRSHAPLAVGRSTTSRDRLGDRSGSPGGTCRPVTPSTTVSTRPPTARGDDGGAARHRLERHDAERLVPGRAAHHVGRPHEARARRLGRPAGGAPPGPPHRSTAASDRSCTATRIVRPGRRPSRPAGDRPARRTAATAAPGRRRRCPCARPGGPRRRSGAFPAGASSAGPSGRNACRSTPQGTTRSRRPSAAQPRSSNASSLQVAMMWSASRAMRRSAASVQRAGVGLTLVAPLDRSRARGTSAAPTRSSVRHRARRCPTSRSARAPRRAGARSRLSRGPR